MKKLKSYFLYFTVFITGAVILMIEILGTRVLAPFYGSTIYVWSSLISVTLVALALGYYLGGKIADRKPFLSTLYWIVFIAGFTVLLIPQYDKWILLQTDTLGFKYGPLAAAFIIFTPTLFILGMVSPLAVKIQTQVLDHLGTTAGNLYSISTFGSLFGGLLAGFYLVPSFSVNFIVNILSLALFCLFLAWQILVLLKKR